MWNSQPQVGYPSIQQDKSSWYYAPILDITQFRKLGIGSPFYHQVSGVGVDFKAYNLKLM